MAADTGIRAAVAKGIPYNVAKDGSSTPLAAVVTANADATYGQPEADLINELKTVVNTVVAALEKHGLAT